MLRKSLHSVKYAWNGLIITWKEEHNFRIEILSALAVVFCIFFFHFSFIEVSLCVFSIVLVLSSEIINTAIEDLCNKIEPAQDPIIGKIKDTIAAFVFVSMFGAFIIACIVFSHHFGFFYNA